MALGLQQHVRFAGVHDMSGIGAWLGRALACVVPSICCDNLPNSMLEGLAAGCPIIASDQPSLREALAGSEAAILVPPGDATALGQAMGDLVDNQDHVRIVSAAARQLARERFSEHSHVVSLERSFNEMLDVRRARCSEAA